MSDSKKLLFVCTGNTCRSPMAERFFNELAEKAGLPFRGESAGIEATNGAPLSRGAAAVFAKRGLAPVEHRARRVDAAMVKNAHEVYVMDAAQRAALVKSFPDSAEKIFVLRADANLTPTDVKDPVGADAAEYEACAASIEEALQIIVRRAPNAPKPV